VTAAAWLAFKTAKGVIYMVSFAIIEVADGLTIVELHHGEPAEEAAAREKGVLVDPGPFPTYEDACDALTDLEAEEEDRD
jgi:hypothetical protein